MKKVILFIIAVMIIVAYSMYQQNGQEQSLQPIASVEPRVIEQETQQEAQIDTPTHVSKDIGLHANSNLVLSRINFEDIVHRCFQGENCELTEDPWTFYQLLKESRKDKGRDLLISYLRSQLKYPEQANRYKDPLKKMIDDFYPPEQLQFQQAAYYNYLGDLSKSLELYLDLQKKAAVNPNLRNAPNLNIANTYYDLRQYRNALPYYELARDEYINREQEVVIPSQNEMILFIEERIREIKEKYL